MQACAASFVAARCDGDVRASLELQPGEPHGDLPGSARCRAFRGVTLVRPNDDANDLTRLEAGADHDERARGGNHELRRGIGSCDRIRGREKGRGGEYGQGAEYPSHLDAGYVPGGDRSHASDIGFMIAVPLLASPRHSAAPL